MKHIYNWLGFAAVLLFLAAGTFADEPLATYNGTLSAGTNSGNLSGNTDMSNQITFNIQNPPSTPPPTPPADTYYPPPKAVEQVTYIPPIQQVEAFAAQLTENVVLNEALSEILGAPLTPEDIANIAEASAQVLAQVSSPSRSLDIGATSTLSLSFEYRGTNSIQNFVVYDTVPKSFARDASQLMINAPGAVVRIVEADPIYSFTYPTIFPGQKIDIKYSVNARVNKSVLNDTSAPLLLLAEKIKAATVTPPIEEKPTPPQETPKPPQTPPEIETPSVPTGKLVETIINSPISKLLLLLSILLAITVFFIKRKIGPNKGLAKNAKKIGPGDQTQATK